ncbi:gamma-glutamylcyclotransferase [Pannus brasiliensis CCIBt3594]|uniref:Gamma-glutamylcyclotransferase n=1 Tax=Pannus brasiliensis CCIBt3594 TaxID=1427578 RepID=A0AAW9QT76_9CHRO
MNQSSDAIRFFICGSALRGQPDHGNLQSAKFIGPARTVARYRLHAAADGWHPAIYETEENGISIPGEIYELSREQYDYLLSTEPPNMYPAEVRLDTGEGLTAMLYPKELIEKYNWPDISGYGGWAAYKANASAVTV